MSLLSTAEYNEKKKEMKTTEDLTLRFCCICAYHDQSVTGIFQTVTSQKGRKDF